MNQFVATPALGRDDRLRIDALADKFECVIKAGESPRIEDFLKEVDEYARPAALASCSTLKSSSAEIDRNR